MACPRHHNYQRHHLHAAYHWKRCSRLESCMATWVYLGLPEYWCDTSSEKRMGIIEAKMK